jgi:glutamate N-acetyltransferase/amino-acid N-acetyltransferase
MAKAPPELVSPLAPERFPDLPAVAGVRAAVGRVGLYKHERNDLLVVALDAGTSVGGAFTQSLTASADVRWCRENLPRGTARALVVNAGNSNAFTGPAGVEKNLATAATMAKLSGCAPEDVYLSATGVIGQPLAPRLIADKLPAQWIALAPPRWEDMARAIMTTDTFPKGAGAVSSVGGTKVGIAGFCKGSGMIAPNMATMLVYVFTDAALSPKVTQALLNRHLGASFNAITVDGDTSTSDTLLLFATGKSGAPLIEDENDPRLADFSKALGEVMLDLALQVVRDGEGAEKLIRIEVTGAKSEASARKIGLEIANSPLVKTAVAGGDANWGRIVMAVGKAYEPIDLDKLTITFGGVVTARGGAVPYDEKPVDAHVRGRRVEIGIDVGIGASAAVIWTCDLTKRYIEINGDYRS